MAYVICNETFPQLVSTNFSISLLYCLQSLLLSKVRLRLKVQLNACYCVWRDNTYISTHWFPDASYGGVPTIHPPDLKAVGLGTVRFCHRATHCVSAGAKRSQAWEPCVQQ